MPFSCKSSQNNELFWEGSQCFKSLVICDSRFESQIAIAIKSRDLEHWVCNGTSLRALRAAVKITVGTSEFCAILVHHAKLEVPWTWEKESRGPKSRKSLEKVGSQKSEKKSWKRFKSQKNLKMGFWETFRTFVETFFRFSGPGPGRLFRDFFETSGPETPSPRSTEPQHQAHPKPWSSLMFN